VMFKRTCRRVAGQDVAPDAGDVERGWGEVLVAAALQGAIVGAVNAALNRGYLLRLSCDRPLGDQPPESEGGTGWVKATNLLPSPPSSRRRVVLYAELGHSPAKRTVRAEADPSPTPCRKSFGVRGGT
jgi:hypothetical protein